MDIHSLPEANPGWAWFLDVDGTVIEIAHHPDAVSVGGRGAALAADTRNSPLQFERFGTLAIGNRSRARFERSASTPGISGADEHAALLC